MALFFVVKSVDVTGAAVSNATVQVSFDGTVNATLAIVGTGIYETRIPDTAVKAKLSVFHNDFWDITQSFDIVRTTTPATIKFEGTQHTNILYTTASSRGTADYNEEVHIVLGHLRDTSTLVLSMATSLGVPIGLAPATIPHFQTPILNPTGTGAGIFNSSPMSVSPASNARVFFAERLTIPKLVAIVDPGWNNSISNLPYHYHLFFTPSIPWDPEEPYGANDVDLVSRYVLTVPFPQGKAMAYQNLGNTPKTMFVFPVSTKTNRGDIETQSGTLRLLQEVNFWVQRMEGRRYPTHPLGFAFMSSFSNGTNSLDRIFASARNNLFYNNVLQGVFVFDGVLNSNNYQSFCTQLNRWHRGGAGRRSYRIYSQYHLWWQHMSQFVPSASVINTTPADTLEAEDSTRTLLWVSLAAWQRIDPSLNTGIVHQFIPARFMEHAAGVSAISR